MVNPEFVAVGGSEYPHGDTREEPPFDVTGKVEVAKERLSRSAIDTVIGLDFWLRERARTNIEPMRDFTPKFIVDSYYHKPKPDSIQLISLDEAIPELEKLVREIDQLGLDKLSSEWKVIRNSRSGLAVFLKDVIKKNRGEPLSRYKDYLSAVSGFEPRLFPEETFENSLLRIGDILQRMGELDTGEKITSERLRKGVANRSQHTRLDLNDFKNTFRRAELRNRARLSEILNCEDLKKVEFDFIWEKVDAFWMFFENMGPDEDNLRANSHERHQEKHDSGYAEMYGGHEPPHFYQGYLIKQEIRTRRLDPAVAYLIIPGPACYQLEGLAQTVGDISEFETTLDGKLAVELYRLEKRVLAHGLYLVEQGELIKDVARFMHKYTLKNSVGENKKLLTEGTTLPFERAYLPVYGISDYDIMQFKDNLGDISNLLPLWFRTPQTPDQMIPPFFRNLIRYAA